MRNIRVCTVKGLDHRGIATTVTVEAYSSLEAAARGLYDICTKGGKVSELVIAEQLPGRQFKVTPGELLKWVSSRSTQDNIGLQSMKRQVREFLTKPSS
jgi:hypothetical protein